MIQMAGYLTTPRQADGNGSAIRTHRQQDLAAAADNAHGRASRSGGARARLAQSGTQSNDASGPQRTVPRVRL